MSWMNQATFSTAPTSSDCVIFVFHMCWNDEFYVANKYCVSTCSPGDTTWSNLRFNVRFRGLISSVAYSKGVFYSVFQSKFWESPYIATYNLALQEWKTYRCPPFIQSRRRVFPKPDVELIDSPDDDGKLLVSYCYGEGYVCVFRFDQSRMEWFRIENFMSDTLYNEYQQFKSENLNNRVLFRSSVINNISLPAAEGEASELANTIQLVGYRRCISSGGKGQSCPQIYDWVCPPTSMWSIVWPGSDARVWIQPRHAHNFMTGLMAEETKPEPEPEEEPDCYDCKSTLDSSSSLLVCLPSCFR